MKLDPTECGKEAGSRVAQHTNSTPEERVKEALISLYVTEGLLRTFLQEMPYPKDEELEELIQEIKLDFQLIGQFFEIEER